MENERRKGQPAIPDNLDELLTEDQKLTLKSLESFGWELMFVRRPLFQEVVSVLSHPDTGQYSVLELNGDVNNISEIELRQQIAKHSLKAEYFSLLTRVLTVFEGARI